MNYEIVPIFNQKTANVWSDFMRIAIVCNKELGYNGKNGYNEQKILQHMAIDWDKKEYNFAFAAYRKSYMIGFAKGYLSKQNEFVFDNLYVLPEYQKMGIGSQLVKSVENTAAIVSDRIVLTFLIESILFWVKQKYVSTGFITMAKSVSLPKNTVVPIFEWNKNNFHVNIDVDDSVFEKNKYQPVFAYFDESGNVNGVAIRTKDGQNIIYVNDDNYNFYSDELLSRALMNIR